MSTTPPRPGTPATPGSPARSAPRSPGKAGAIPPAQKSGNTRMELPPDAYVSDTQRSKFALRGNKYNTEGKPTMVAVNQFRLKTFSYDKKIYQYDINISPASNKRLPVRKIMEHRTTKEKLQPYNYPMWIFDGKALAWAPVPVKELRFTVDLDDEKRASGAEPRAGAVYHVVIRQTTEINAAALRGYLEGKIQFNNVVVEALSFLDHLLRQGPSERLLGIKRNFYDTEAKGHHLGDGGVVEVHKGLYASIRLSQNLKSGGIGLSLNTDVANTAFWTGDQRLDVMLPRFLANCDSRWRHLTVAKLGEELRPVKRKGDNDHWHSSDAFKHLRKLRRLKFTVKHRGRTGPAAEKVYSILDFMFDEQKYGRDGATSRTVKFDYNGQETSVLEYYQKKYNQPLRATNLPLIDAGKGGAIPIELANILPMQRYPFKLNADQTAAMIKVAVTRPMERRKAIEDKVRMLKLAEDPYLKHYGVEFEENFTNTQAKIIQPPIVKFREGSVKPMFSGRWNIQNLKFWQQNRLDLTSWGIVAMGDCCDKNALVSFTSTFKMTFRKHGGKCETDAVIVPPWSLENPGRPSKEDITAGGTNGAEVVSRAHQYISKKAGHHTQFLFIVVPTKNSPYYERLKKSADCRFAILSQVVQRHHVMNNQGQYHSNVCMKVNAKLGGATARTDPPWPTDKTYFPKSRPTMVVGVDVSHAAPGGNTASIAAMTMNADANCIRFNAAVQTNGYRTEIITEKNMANMFGQLVTSWRIGHPGLFPAHIMYFRDGVGEGQFSQVLDLEIGAIRKYFASMGKNCPKITVIVATKRHHIRLFPPRGSGDKNSNPLPGTLVENEVTHPFMLDFYLNSHVAIQGTARPVHYYVLLDEFNVPINGLQKMIYHQCYSYIRSTTPVSLHPAVYYAHLAGSRARSHENAASGDGPRHGGAGHELLIDRIAKGFHIGPKAEDLKGEEAPDLLPLGPRDRSDFMERTMWFV